MVRRGWILILALGADAIVDGLISRIRYAEFPSRCVTPGAAVCPGVAVAAVHSRPGIGRAD
jgi:hypothetical protein